MKMNQHPLVSVIIPSYNHEKYIEKCLDSIIEEGYPNLEVIIIDDGSKDKTYEKIKNWQVEKGHLLTRVELKRQKNQGIAKTLNHAVRLSTGDYITPLASDDFLLKGGIEKRLRFLEENPQLLAVFGDCLVVDENNNIILQSGISELYPNGARIKALKNQKLIAMELISRWSVLGPVFLMRKSTCDIVGYYDESLTVEDRDFYLRLLTRGTLGFVDYKVACYRWHAGNVVKDPIGNDLRDESLRIALLKASRVAKGILRIELILQYQVKYNDNWRKERGRRRVRGAIKSILVRTAWKILLLYQNLRLSFMRI